VIPLEHSGMENVKIQDRCGATAYHVPQGTFIIYAPAKGLNGNDVANVPTTEVAPTILRNFNVAIPTYMKKGLTL